MGGRNGVDFWEKDNKCLLLNFQSAVPMLVESSGVWVSRFMKPVRGSDCTAHREWWAHLQGARGVRRRLRMQPQISLISEKSKGVCARGNRGRVERGKEQSSSDWSKRKWLVLSNIAGSKYVLDSISWVQRDLKGLIASPEESLELAQGYLPHCHTAYYFLSTAGPQVTLFCLALFGYNDDVP